MEGAIAFSKVGWITQYHILHLNNYIIYLLFVEKACDDSSPIASNSEERRNSRQSRQEKTAATPKRFSHHKKQKERQTPFDKRMTPVSVFPQHKKMSKVFMNFLT